MITSRRREPIVMPAQDTDESKMLAEKTQQFLIWKWGDEDMPIKFEDWVRNSYIAKIGVLKIRWDLKKDDYVIEVKRSQKILVDKDATDEYNAKFIAEFREDILDDLVDMFPKAKIKLIEKFGAQMGTKIHWLEYWTNDFVVCKVNEIILKKQKNPTWNWDEKDRSEKIKQLKEKWSQTRKDKTEKLKNVLLNYFNEPRKPYVVLSLKNLGKTIYADTNDFEQAIVGQDITNRRKRQIDRAVIHSLGRVVISGSYIDKNEAKKLVSNPNAPIWLEKGNAGDAVSYISPQPISPILLEDFRDTKAEMDNTMGTHGTTRGEQGPTETATGRQILKTGDLGRSDGPMQRIDVKLELLFGWMLQMAKVYYDETHFCKILGKEGATPYLKFSTDDIEDGIEVICKSQMTAYKAQKQQQANERMAAKAIDPLTYYEMIDEPNPKEKARRLMLYQIDPKLYAAEFLMGEGTPGMENTPEGQAQDEQKRLMAGEQVPPNKTVDKTHLDEHAKWLQNPEFVNLEDVEIKQNAQNHIQGEVEILKQKQNNIQTNAQSIRT